MISKKEDRNGDQYQHNSSIIPFTDKYFTQIEPITLSGREFCRKAHRLSDLSELEILNAEIEPHYRRDCITLLSRILKVSRQTVLNWGEGPDFSAMPIQHQRFLGVFWERYELHVENKKLKRHNEKT